MRRNPADGAQKADMKIQILIRSREKKQQKLSERQTNPAGEGINEGVQVGKDRKSEKIEQEMVKTIARPDRAHFLFLLNT